MSFRLTNAVAEDTSPTAPVTHASYFSDSAWDASVVRTSAIAPILNESPILRDPQPGLIPWSPAENNPVRQGIIFNEQFPPSGYTGPSSVLPRETQTLPDFVPVEDRWRIGMQPWDRYQQGHACIESEYPFVEGSIRDPYHQNVLKGDYPILGQHTFLTITATEDFLMEGRQVPTPNTPFESTPGPNSSEFFGDPDQFFLNNNTVLSFDLVHGDSSFKPADWRVKITQIFNENHLVADEFGVVGPSIYKGTARTRFDYAIEEWFVETKLADLSADYDFMSVRLGSQQFSSDFRGFIFSDTNRGVRLFGTRNANRDQFNVLWFDQAEKDTNSSLNTFEDRHQNVVVLNYFRQDLIWPGYTGSLSYHFNDDQASFKFDENDFLVRPAATGVFAPHKVQAHYLGWSGDGHINRFNISHAYYMVIGEDSLNPLAGRPVDIFAQMAACELSYDRDWVRFRTSYFWASGDGNINDNRATGFDTIFDNPNFAGGQFSYWQRQQVKLLGANLSNRFSLVPNLRSNKIEGQANFVNPGLHLLNFGFDTSLTPKVKFINNLNFLWFDQTEVLEQFVFQDGIRNFIGADLSTGIEYRPRLNNNIILTGGVSGLLPGQGFKDIYNPLVGERNGGFIASFFNGVVTY